MNQPDRAEYAGLVSRALAYLLDALIVAFLVSGTALVLVVVAAVAGTFPRDLARGLISVYAVLLPSVLAVYCALFWLLAGRTPGMAVLGLRVRRADGRPVRWLAALVRGVLVACFPVGALWLLVDRRRQALHDKAAGTVVVRPVIPPG